MCPFKPKLCKDTRSPEEVKGAILKASEHEFAMQGYQGASLSTIAKEAKVANSLINYYFKGKEGLFTAMIEATVGERKASMQRFLEEPRSREEIPVRIEMFAHEMFESFGKNLNAFEIIQREWKAGNPLVKELFEKHMLQNFMGVVGFFKICQDKGYLKKEVDPFLVARLLFTCICDTARNDFLAKEYFGKSIEQPEYRNSVVQHILTLFLNGVMS